MPTLAADSALEDCLESLAVQTLRDFETIVIDNSGERRASRLEGRYAWLRILFNDSNAGFGGAVNQGIRASASPFIAVLNDDAAPHPHWLAAMLEALDARYEIGMCAPQIRLDGEHLDSAGMLIARDGSSKQRGHKEPAQRFAGAGQALFPSGCAALYRRDMLEDIGLFDERFFLYCEDTDLGLRARWKLWECVYAPEAVVEHRYSHSAGSASAMKAFYVERNRLFVVVKNFTAMQLLAAPVFSLVRYFWHAVYLLKGQGKAAQVQAPASLPWVLIQAWSSLIRHLPALWRDRRRIRGTARATPRQFERLLAAYRISERQVASL